MFEWFGELDLGTKAFIIGLVVLFVWNLMRPKNKSAHKSGPTDISGQNKPPGGG